MEAEWRSQPVNLTTRTRISIIIQADAERMACVVLNGGNLNKSHRKQ